MILGVILHQMMMVLKHKQLIRKTDCIKERAKGKCNTVAEQWQKTQRKLFSLKAKKVQLKNCFREMSGYTTSSFQGLLLSLCSGINSGGSQVAKCSAKS